MKHRKSSHHENKITVLHFRHSINNLHNNIILLISMLAGGVVQAPSVFYYLKEMNFSLHNNSGEIKWEIERS